MVPNPFLRYEPTEEQINEQLTYTKRELAVKLLKSRRQTRRAEDRGDYWQKSNGHKASAICWIIAGWIMTVIIMRLA